MKKLYQKPQVVVETMFLDQPIATSTCNINFHTDEDVKLLKELGCFLDSSSCVIPVLSNGGFDWDGDGEKDVGFHDTICYHTNMDMLFAS